VAQRADDAGAGQPLVHLEPEQAQRGGDDAGRAPLLERELGVRVEAAPQRDHVVHAAVGGAVHALHRGLHRDPFVGSAVE
jgi:hypothetical protein